MLTPIVARSQADTIATPALRYWRYTVALTQAQLAQRAGTSESTIARLEGGGRTHSSIVRRLTDVLVEDIDEWGRDLGCLSHRPGADEPQLVDLTQPLTAEQREWVAQGDA